MPPYRPRPHTINAIRIASDNHDEITALLGGPRQARIAPAHVPAHDRGLTGGIQITTLDGITWACNGDWVAVYPDGDFKVWPDDDFRRLYQEAAT